MKVTIPFGIEGNRQQIAYEGLDKLRHLSDTIVVIENDSLLKMVPDLPIEEAFSVADEVLANYIYSIINTVTQPSLINVDFADLKTTISKGGVTVCGVGEAKGKDRAVVAVKKALENPLITVDYSTGTAALIHVTGGATMSLKEASSVVELIRKELNPNVDVIWGTKVDSELGEVMRITIVISGVQSEQIFSKHKKQFSSVSVSAPYDKLGQMIEVIPSKPKENWLKQETRPTLSDLRKKLSETKEKKEEKSESLEDDHDDFWEELGLSKGLN
ncbi:MAG: cell division protein FtsZ [Candidatus Thorarchaeota archaeon]